MGLLKHISTYHIKNIQIVLKTRNLKLMQENTIEIIGISYVHTYINICAHTTAMHATIVCESFQFAPWRMQQKCNCVQRL